MKVKVLGKTGVRSGEYNGNAWSHRKLYVYYNDGSVNDLDGHMCEALKVSPQISLDDVKAGDMAEVTFNRYGRVTGVKRLTA